MKFLSLFVLLLFSHCLKAQIIYPKKDISTCLIGYVDYTQKWIIEPKFTEGGAFVDGSAIVRYSNKNAIIDTIGNFVLEPDYESIFRTENFKINPRYIASKEDKFYLFDQDIKIITPNGFGRIEQIPYSNYFLYSNAKQNQKWGILENNGNVLSPEIFTSSVYQYMKDANRVFEFEENKLWGLYDARKKKIIVNAEYHSFYSISNRIFYTSRIIEQASDGSNQKLIFRLIDRSGNLIAGEIYDSVITTRQFPGGYYSFPKNLIFVVLKKGNRYKFWGGEAVNEYKAWYQKLPVYLKHENFLVKKNNIYGIFNLSKKQIIPIKYDKVWSGESYFLCQQEMLWAVFDTNGVNLSGFKYSEIEFAANSQHIYGLTSKGKILNINTSNGDESTFDFDKYKRIMLANEEVIKLSLNGKDVYFDLQGNRVSSDDFSSLPDYFSEDDSPSIFSNMKGSGMINNRLDIIVPAIYDTILEAYDKSYDYKVFWIIKNGKWGMLDEKGKVILSPDYEIPNIFGEWTWYNQDCLFEFESPIIIGIKQDSNILFDTNKGIISPAIGRKIISCKNSLDYFFKSINGKYGLLNTDGQVIIPPLSEKYPYISGDTALIIADNQFHYFIISKKKLLEKSLSEAEIEKTIMTLFNKGVFGKDIDFFPNCSEEVKKEFLFEVYFSKYFERPDEIFTPNQILKSILPFYDFYYCDIDWCYRSVNETFNNVEDQCWPPGYGTFNEIGYAFTPLSQTDFMLETNSITYGHGSGDYSSFEYYSLMDNKLKAIGIKDLFINTIQLFDFLSHEVLNSSEVKEISDQIDCTVDLKLINDETELAIAEDGLHCMIPYWDMGEYQIDVLIPWKDLKQYIPANGRLEKIIRYLKEKRIEE